MSGDQSLKLGGGRKDIQASGWGEIHKVGFRVFACDSQFDDPAERFAGWDQEVLSFSAETLEECSLA